MLNKDDAIKIERRLHGKNKKQYNLVYKFHCKFDGCTNIVSSYNSYLKNHSGYCRVHSHANINEPFLGTYNYIKDSVLRTNKKRNRHIEFNLSYEDFLFLTQIGCCHYCGEPNIIWKPFIGNGQHRSNLDRKDNNLGYTKENVVVSCKDCNLMKRDWLSYDEFKAMRLFLKKWRNGTLEDKEELIHILVSWNMKVNFN